MMFLTHMLFAALIYLFLKPIFPIANKYVFFLVLIIAALVPDLDEPKAKLSKKFGFLSTFINLIFGHRGLFHSIIMGLVLSVLVFFVSNYSYSIAFFVGFLSHLVADSFTMQGTKMFYPLSNLRLRWRIITGSLAEKMLQMLMIFIVFYKVL